MSMGWRWEGLQTASCDHWNLSCSREMAGDSKVSGFGAPSCTSCCLVLAWSRTRRHCLLLSDMYVEVNNRMHGHGVFTWADGRTYAWKLSFLSVCIEFLGSPGLLHEGLLFEWFGWKPQPRHNLLVHPLNFRCFLLKWNPHWESHPTWNSSNVAPTQGRAIQGSGKLSWWSERFPVGIIKQWLGPASLELHLFWQLGDAVSSFLFSLGRGIKKKIKSDQKKIKSDQKNNKIGSKKK